MEKEKTNFLSCLIALLLTAIAAIVMPQTAMAASNDNGEFNTPAQAFSWYAKGQGCMHLTLKLCNSSPKRTLKHAVLTLTDTKTGEEINAFFINEHNSDAAQTSIYHVSNFLYQETCLFATNTEKTGQKDYIGYEHNNSTITYGDGVSYKGPAYPFFVTRNATTLNNASDHSDSYAEFDWYYSSRLAGRTFKVSVKYAQIWQDGGYVPYEAINFATMELEPIDLQAYDAIPGTESEDAGIIKIPFTCDRPINYAKASVKVNGQWKDLGTTQLDGKSYNGFITIPSYEAYESLKLTANVVVSSWTDATGNTPNKIEGDYTIYKEDIPTIHGPKMLTAKMADIQTDIAHSGSVELKWQINDVGKEDLLEGDIFTVQRSLTGRIEDYEDIGSVIFDTDSANYSFTDTTLISSLVDTLIDKDLQIPLVRYRIFRAAANGLWGIEHNPTVMYAMPQIPSLYLLQPKNMTAEWDNEEERKLKVKWDYDNLNKDTRLMVWDERAEMVIKYYMRNRNSQIVDSAQYVLSLNELQKRETVLTLNRSCVYYDFKMETLNATSPIGKGTRNVYVKLKDTSDWINFASRVNKGETSLNAIMLSDIYMSGDNNIVGHDVEYKGVFNGNGKKLECSIITNNQNSAPFRYLGDGAVIAYLHTSGKIETKGLYGASFAAQPHNGTISIENCSSTTQVQSNIRNISDVYCGGIVGHVNSKATLHINNCCFLGIFSQTGNSTYNWGGFIGRKDGDSFVFLRNNYINASIANKCNGYGFVTDANSNRSAFNLFMQDCVYTNTVNGVAQGTYSENAPTNEILREGAPVMYSFDYTTFEKYRISMSDDVILKYKGFYYQNSGKVLTESLTTTTRQSSVTLNWETDGGAIDYFEIYRCKNAEGETWEKIATNVINMEYEDKTVKPIFTYKYKVASLISCEGEDRVFTKEKEGNCMQTGTIEGYVRFADGSGIPGRSVSVSAYGTDADANLTKRVVTDDAGFYRIDGLPYWNGQTGNYLVTVDVNTTDLSADCQGGLYATFDADSNLEQNKSFTVTSGVKLAGLVMYKGTSIPVQGVRFLVDGHEVRSGKKAVTSDFEGKYSFRVLAGRHTVQAVKDGHVFTDEGYYISNNSKEVDIITDDPQLYFYDDTRVKLIGRIAGGKQQGDLPLDNSLSKNNLGNDIKMVMTLEGDNASWLVFENTQKSLTERDTTYIHNKHKRGDTNIYKTAVHTNRHRMVVTPDEKTGEYQVWLPPVKWKIQQITASGYSTLFQDGKTSDVIDLTDSLTMHTDVMDGKWAMAPGDTLEHVEVTYNAQYNRIYRSPIQLDYEQIGYDNFTYFGDRIYTAQSLVGDKVKVPLVYQKDNKVVYTFGAPVFNVDRQYPLLINAVEKYYYNNNTQSDTVDVVNVDGGFVTIRNSMISGTHRDTLSLDKNGEGIYILTAEQRPYILTGKDALYTVNFTLEKDGVTYEAAPLKAFTLNQYAKPGAKDYASVSAPLLIDVLRDPPGSGSSAKLSKGSTLKMAYQMDMSWSGGLSLAIQAGTGMNQYAGISILGASTGVLINAETHFKTSFDLIFSGTGQRAFSYTMTANEDITTSTASTMVGADADVYMGLVTNVFLRPSVMVRAIPDSTFQHKIGELASGRMVEIASGYGDDGGLFHLVRDEAIGYGQRITSDFVHSQQYIIKQLIPGLANDAVALMYSGTESSAQALANSTGKPVYLSLRSIDDDRFGMLNTDPTTNQYVYNSTRTRGNYNQSEMNYLIVLPNTDDGTTETDEIYNYANLIEGWTNIIAQNEQQKLEATDLVKHFDVDGGVGMSYSEDFSTEYNNSHTYKQPFTSWMNNYFEWDDVNEDKNSNGGVTALAGITALLGKTAAQFLGSIFTKNLGKSTAIGTENKELGSRQVAEGITEHYIYTALKFTGVKWNFGLTPVLSYDLTPKQTTNTKYNRKESFTIKMDKSCHLLFDVYRVNTINDNTENSTVTGNLESDRDIFVETNFMRNVEYVKNFLDRSLGFYSKADFVYPKSFVYRTRGGATARTWEDERRTIFYQAGTVLDERTRKIENPIIKMDKQSLSGVPYGEPARFKVYITNESEEPAAVSGVLRFFTLYADAKANPNGAKLYIDGMPLTQDGITVMALPGEVTTKSLEVYAGENFDYENLKLSVISQGDLACFNEVAFSVHYLHTAGSVTISTPGDKWIMNTDAPYDSIKGWYMPVIISGFNRNQKNFDHIEFQYKESTRGDDYWTNLCSFYADSLYYRQASGTREMMPSNGYINTRFFGEGVVMEKAYDLRAVLFCRNGNSYITSSSPVLTGIKDTQLPQLFGNAEPKDGILYNGDNIIFNFSENIEHNYLRQATNFEVMGETNEIALQEEPALLFTGKGYAETDARRNFANKSIAVDMMVMPDETGQSMPLFSHGTDGNKLQLWVTDDYKLKAVVDTVEYSSKVSIQKGNMQHVAIILDNKNHTLQLYNDSIIGTFQNVTYSGYGPLIFGATNESATEDRSTYKGRMIEARVWNRTMTESLMRLYAKHKLTGYEMGLVDYYPMNEGKGDIITDVAQGAHADLVETTWALPHGMSLRLDWSEEKDIKGIKILSDRMTRGAEQDYTLMFWFKTDTEGQGALISNGSGRKTDTDARNKFFIGFENEKLIYRSNGMELNLGSGLNDNKWHHYAMTVNRSRKVANFYVDQTLKESVQADTLGGMTGNDFYLGNMVWHEAGPKADVIHYQNAISANFDEITLFAQALPPTLIKHYSTKSPSGSEKGLLTYMSFSRQERNANNTLEFKPYAMSQVIHYDMDGKPTTQVDSVFAEPINYIKNHIDANIGAPVQANLELKNLAFSFVGRDNQLLVNIDELDSRINKRNIFVTVNEIPDLNGNYMASPATVEYFVDRNPLRWGQRNIKTILYDDEVDYISTTITNTSSASHSYTIENLPNWITIDHTENIIDGQSEQEITFTISKDLNVGTYDETLYLTDENGLTEPLLINITKLGYMPDNWEVEDGMKRYSMSIVGRAKIGTAIVTDTKDRIGVFDTKGRTMGIGEVSYNESSGVSLVYLTVFDSTVTEKPLTFKLWHSRTGKVMMLRPDRTITFIPSTIIGSVKDPVIFSTTNQYVQTVNLEKGWNWISMNVYNDSFRNINQLLANYTWKEGDIFVDDNERLTLVYKNNRWLKNQTDEVADKIKIKNSRGYRIYSHVNTQMEFVGDKLDQVSMRTIPVKKGWNNIGYTPMINLPVSTALTDYSPFASDRDVIKSREEFAIFTETQYGTGYWSGSLQYLKPGEGYMLYRNTDSEVSFKYPYYEPGSTFFEYTATEAKPMTAYAYNMSLAAEIEGIEVEENDKLIALSDGEVRGTATLVDSVYYMNIAGEAKAANITFAIERDGEIIATSDNTMAYENNTVSGTPLEPTKIDFTRTESVKLSDDWYTVDGVKLSGEPKKSGVYIHNGNKVVIQ